MVKEAQSEVVIGNCTPKKYYDTVYGDDTCVKIFHKTVTEDSNAKVSSWENGKRSVRFLMPMNVPQMLKKVIGADAIIVVETQIVSWSGTSSFTVTSEPMLDFPGAAKFTTKGIITITGQEDGSVKVQCIVQCSAAMPWPMQSTVEGIMADQAKASTMEFLEFCRDFYQNASTAVSTQIPQVPAGEGLEADEFQDAVEVFGAAPASPSATVTLSSTQPARPEDAILSYLQQIQCSTAETAEILLRIDTNMAAIRHALLPGKEGTVTLVQPRPLISGTSLAVISFVALGAAAGSMWYIKYRQR